RLKGNGVAVGEIPAIEDQPVGAFANVVLPTDADFFRRQRANADFSRGRVCVVADGIGPAGEPVVVAVRACLEFVGATGRKILDDRPGSGAGKERGISDPFTFALKPVLNLVVIAVIRRWVEGN